MHIGQNNGKFKYNLGGTALEETTTEKDVGILVSSTLKPSAQCARAAEQANRTLGQLSRGVSYRDRKTFVRLYCSHVRPSLEYAVQAWCPYTAADKEVLERVQRRAVGMVTGLAGRTYAEKLVELRLPSLEARRTRGDLVQAFRILSGVDKVDPSTWFDLAASRVRQGAAATRSTSQPLALEPRKARTELRANFFSMRVTPSFNSLPEDIKLAPSVNAFKNRLDKLQLGPTERRVRQGTLLLGARDDVAPRNTT